MRLAQIILPEYDNDGNTVIDAHRYLQKALSEMFGGFTSLRSSGGWVDPKSGTLHTEPGKVYQVAMDSHEWAMGELRHIATTAGIMARQKAIFVVFPTAEVEIIDLEEPIVIDSLTAMDEHVGENLHFMHGLEDIKRLNENAHTAIIPSQIDTDEVERATKYVKLLRTGYGLLSEERNDVADMLIAAYGIVED